MKKLVIAMIVFLMSCSSENNCGYLDSNNLYVDEQAGFSLVLLEDKMKADSAVILITSSDDRIDMKRWKISNGQKRLNCNDKHFVFEFKITENRVFYTVTEVKL